MRSLNFRPLSSSSSSVTIYDVDISILWFRFDLTRARPFCLNYSLHRSNRLNLDAHVCFTVDRSIEHLTSNRPSVHVHSLARDNDMIHTYDEREWMRLFVRSRPFVHPSAHLGDNEMARERERERKRFSFKVDWSSCSLFLIRREGERQRKWRRLYKVVRWQRSNGETLRRDLMNEESSHLRLFFLLFEKILLYSFVPTLSLRPGAELLSTLFWGILGCSFLLLFPCGNIFQWTVLGQRLTEVMGIISTGSTEPFRETTEAEMNIATVSLATIFMKLAVVPF